MLIPVLLALVPQVTSVPLESPTGEDDGISASAVTFTVDGRGLIIPHRLSATLNLIAMAQRQVVASGARHGSTLNSVVTDDGTRVLFANNSEYELNIHALPSLAQIGNVAIPHQVGDVVVDGSGIRAVVLGYNGDRRATIVDLATATIERVFQVIAPDGLQLAGWGIADDDTTFIGIGRRRILAYDLTTGALVLDQNFGTGRRAQRLRLRSDRTRAYVLVEEQVSGPNTLTIDEFALPGLTLLSTTPTGARGSSQLVSISSDGARAVVAGLNGTYAVDIAAGTNRLLDVRYPVDVAISVDGTVVATMLRDRALVHDFATGALLGDIAGPRGGRGDVLRRSPTVSLFALLGSERDRVGFIDATQPGTIAFDDMSSGRGEEADGPYSVSFLDRGRQAAAVGRASDDLRIVDLEAAAVVARFPLHRQPIGVVSLDDTRLAVAHGRDELVDIVDSTTGVLASIPIGLPAEQIEAVPGSDLVWVYAADYQARALLRVDTAAAVVTASIPLSAPITNYVHLPPVAFDHANGRAFAIDPIAGRIEMIDLAGGVVVDLESYRPGGAGQVFLAPDGARVTVLSSANEAASYTVGPAGLTPSWTYNCVTDPPGVESNAYGFQSADGSRLILDFRLANGPPPPGVCPGALIFDASTGMPAAWSGASDPWAPPVASIERDEVLWESGSRIWQHRFTGTAFEPGTTVLSFAGYLETQPRRDPVSGMTIATGGSWVSGTHTEIFAIIDPLWDIVTPHCDPATPNATGLPAVLDLNGGGFVGNLLVATVRDLDPNGMVGFLLVADAWSTPSAVPQSPGFLCLRGSIGRYVGQVQVADASGMQRFEINTEQLPLSSGFVAAQAGESWTFQSWYRDRTPAGTPVSNFSNAETITLR